MEKKKYEGVKLDVIAIEAADVITTSECFKVAVPCDGACCEMYEAGY